MKNTRNNSYFFFLVSLLLLAVTPAYAQDKTAEIDKIFSALKPDEPGCSVALSHNGKAGRQPRLRLGRPRARRSDQPEHDLRCRLGGKAVRCGLGPPPG